VSRPLLTRKLQKVMQDASGQSSAVHALLCRGVTVDPSLATRPGDGLFDGGGDVHIASISNRPSSEIHSEAQVRAAFMRAAEVGGVTPELRKRFADMKSSMRSALNGIELNRAKYTSFSRHYTSARVLREIANVLQPLLQAGDTFVDFACGQNSFGGMLVDPATKMPLPVRAFDLISPVDKTADFERRNWFSVSSGELPAGELVIGLNPPFGHNNKTAIDFVRHSLCMKPRMLVLIMPATNYQPEGYELVHQDDQLCRGYAFYVPGSASANWINAKNVDPQLYVYRRKEGMPGPGQRDTYCVHQQDLIRKVRNRKRKSFEWAKQSEMASRQEQERLCQPCRT